MTAQGNTPEKKSPINNGEKQSDPEENTSGVKSPDTGHNSGSSSSNSGSSSSSGSSNSSSPSSSSSGSSNSSSSSSSSSGSSSNSSDESTDKTSEAIKGMMGTGSSPGSKIAKAGAGAVIGSVDKATKLDDEDEEKEDKASVDPLKKTMKAAGSSASAAKGASAASMFMMMKNLLFNGAAMAANLAKGFMGTVLNGIKAIGSWFAGVGSWISGVTGGFISAVAGTVITAGTAVATVIVTAAVAVGILTPTVIDDPLFDCDDVLQQTIAENKTTEAGDVNAAQLANAETIYSVFSAWGMTDEAIAGALGNFDVESGMDPTGVETIYDEPLHIGARKAKAEADGFDVHKVSPEYGDTYPNIVNVGIGLGQWTDTADGSTGNTDLRKFAKSNGQNWYDLKNQLAFMMSDYDGHKADLEAYMRKSFGTPEEAALDFAANWERNTALAQQERQDRAKEWFVRMSDWEKDDALGESLLAQAGATLKEANDNAVSSAYEQCVSSKNLNFDNSTIASAMVSYSWPYRSQAIANKGTDLYVEVHDKVLPGDEYYASCDRSVASAVRWGGGDDNFPAGAVPAQKTYLDANPEKWQKVPWDGDKSKLLPGDIGISPSENHIIMYVGKDLIEGRYPDGNVEPGAEVAEGSLDAGMSKEPNENTLSPHLAGLNGRTDYTFYRNVKPEENSKFKDVISSASGLFGDVSKDAAGAIKAAESQLGVPYVWGASSPGVGMDCSGLTLFSWGQAGVKLPRTADQQYRGGGKQVPFEQRQAGDLVFWAEGGQGRAYHVAILTGPNTIIHAPVPGQVVTRAPLYGLNNILPYVVRP